MSKTQESMDERGPGAQLSLVTTVERETAEIRMAPAGSDESESRELIHALRRFHLGDPSVKDAGEPVVERLLPALLHPYRDVSRIRYEYPLYLYPEGEAEGPVAVPISQYLEECVSAFAPGEGGAKMLRDNLPWIERHLRDQLRGKRAPIAARPLVEQASAALQKQMSLSDDNRDKLQEDLDSLLAQVPDAGRFLAYSRHVTLHLMLHAVAHRASARRQRLRAEVERSAQGLRELLRIDQAKSSGSGGSGSRFFNPDALKGVTAQHAHGSESLSPERKARVELALASLEAYTEDPVIMHCVAQIADTELSEFDRLALTTDQDPCTAAVALFDEHAAKCTQLFKALRTAQLEVAGAYDATIHDSWFENFDWQAFSEEELQLVPVVVALITAEHAATEGIQAFSRVLLSGKPVQILAMIPAYDNPGVPADQDPLASFRMELGYFGIGHRQAVVAQSSAARHEHLLEGFLCALDGLRTSLHLVDDGFHPQDLYLDPWIVASAALESRAHPYVQINPTAGDASAERLSFAGNPQSGVDWPINHLEYRDEEGTACELELPFTFVDYALLIPKLWSHFRVIPDACAGDDLIPVDEYLSLPSDQASRRLPFIWAVDAEGQMRRVLVSRVLMFACRDRLNYWHTLQELSGVRNRHVELAVEHAREEEQAAAAAALEESNAAHEEEVERVRSETAGDVMAKLADVLLGMDLSAMTAGASAAPVAAPSAPAPEAAAVAVEEEAAAPVEEVAAEEEEEAVAITEPYIDSILCTTCDDCMAVNKMVFQYNDNKQAYIADPKAGTYAQLVEAAEACPASCIHPGQPLDPSEPGLDELIARAAAYN